MFECMLLRVCIGGGEGEGEGGRGRRVYVCVRVYIYVYLSPCNLRNGKLIHLLYC